MKDAALVYTIVTDLQRVAPLYGRCWAMISSITSLPTHVYKWSCWSTYTMCHWVSESCQNASDQGPSRFSHVYKYRRDIAAKTVTQWIGMVKNQDTGEHVPSQWRYGPETKHIYFKAIHTGIVARSILQHCLRYCCFSK